MAKYGEDVWVWVPVSFPRNTVSGLWATILRVRGGASIGGKVFSKGVGFKVGEGSWVRV